ncbi:RNA polymerase sigma-70 factor [Protaetiibacter intestinalis]|uniref:RNA polymerase sigma-70 factor n=1 Tax=Protaetiibacter intestinalis TaxID=2419774 RepID=A0A387B5Z5_9MICO|nr:RNA polymerase sigma-70 factor [Protaetiibacter intestinalis]AYF97178.1 RNA polymerase sigma-70 factor [Protaetiibacter intestinalis]
MESELATALAVYQSARGRLFGVAYRMLGSVAEAEDILQEVWLRWQRVDHATVQEPTAFLVTMTTRLAINELQSARVRRESYIGPWLPEPVDTSADPTLGAERAEALSFAVLLMLERLTPTERAAYVLREAFAYSYEQISSVVQVSEVATRQLVSRARKHLALERHREVPKAEQRRLLSAFVTAATTGDLRDLERLLAEDVVSYSDGGGLVRASRIPVAGRETVAKFVRAFQSHFWNGIDVVEAEANGQPTVVLSRGDDTIAVLALTTASDGIRQLLWMMNPQKLGAVASRGR